MLDCASGIAVKMSPSINNSQEDYESKRFLTAFGQYQPVAYSWGMGRVAKDAEWRKRGGCDFGVTFVDPPPVQTLGVFRHLEVWNGEHDAHISKKRYV